MESKKVVTSGPVTPSTINTPLDFRTRVNTVDEIYNIDLPFVGMIVYVINEDKYYKIKTLKSKEIGLQVIENAAVDTFEDINTNNLMTKENPSGTGSFSMNRKSNTDIGIRSSTFGHNNIASGIQSFAEGCNTEAGGESSHAEGQYTKAKGESSHAEGQYTKAKGESSHAEGNQTVTYAPCSHVEGSLTQIGANASCSHAEGYNTSCSGPNSHAEGLRTCAYGNSQHVQGKDNIADRDNRYAHIVGNGKGTTSGIIESNAHTLDWDGNAWFQGDVFVGGTSQDDGFKLATENETIHLQNQITLLRNFVDFQIPNADQRIETLQQEIEQLRIMIEELKNNQ